MNEMQQDSSGNRISSTEEGVYYSQDGNELYFYDKEDSVGDSK
jgi:hypothetical protein